MNEETREELMGAVTDAIVSQMTLEDMRTRTWDSIYEDLLCQSDWELEECAKEYCPEVLDSVL